MAKIKADILGNTPSIGETIVFNPPSTKGLVYGKCIGFSSTGIPMINAINKANFVVDHHIKTVGFYTPKTGFVVIKKGIHYQGDRLFTKESLFLFAGYCRIKMDMGEGDVSVIYKQFLEDLG